MTVKKGADREILFLFGIIICSVFTFSFFTINLSSFVLADVNVSNGAGNLTSLANGTNHSSINGLIFWNVTFLNNSDINISGTGQTDVNVTLYFNKSDTGGQIPTLLTQNSSQCALAGTYAATAPFACWGYLTINSTHDGQWNVTAAITNGSDNVINGTAGGFLAYFDSTVPDVQAANFSAPLTGQNKTGTIVLNVSLVDSTLGLQTVYFNITNGSNSQVAFVSAANSAGDAWNASFDTSTIAPDGLHNITVYANDSVGNLNSSALVYSVDFDNVAPVGTFTCDATNVKTDTVITCSCTSGSPVSFTANPDTSVAGTFTTSCTISTNSLSTTYNVEYIVSSRGGSVGGSGGGSSSGGGGSAALSPIVGGVFPISTSQLDSGFRATFSEDSKMNVDFQASSEESVGMHTIQIQEITNTQVTLLIQSDPVTVTVLLGENKKVDMDGDDVYDLSVQYLSYSEAGNRADIIVTRIEEQVDLQPVNSTDEESREYSFPNKQGIATGAVILILLVAIWFYLKSKKSSKKKRR